MKPEGRVSKPVESNVPTPEPVAVRTATRILTAVALPVPPPVAVLNLTMFIEEEAVPKPDAVAVTVKTARTPR